MERRKEGSKTKTTQLVGRLRVPLPAASRLRCCCCCCCCCWNLAKLRVRSASWSTAAVTGAPRKCSHCLTMAIMSAMYRLLGREDEKNTTKKAKKEKQARPDHVQLALHPLGVVVLEAPYLPLEAPEHVVHHSVVTVFCCLFAFFQQTSKEKRNATHVLILRCASCRIFSTSSCLDCCLRTVWKQSATTTTARRRQRR